MGVDTRLYINSKWRCDNLKGLLVNVIGVKDFEFRNTHTPDYITATFKFKHEDRMLSIHNHIKTPIGTCTLLTLSANENSHDLFKQIAENIGGFFEKYDSEGEMVEIRGKFSEENGLSYFLKYAIIEHGIEENDLAGMIKAIKHWEKVISKSTIQF